MRIPAERLPTDRRSRDDVLQDYLAEWVPRSRKEGADWLVSARPPPDAGYYVDPQIQHGLAWWRKEFGRTPLRDVLLSHRSRARVGLSLSDAWTLHTFARALANTPRDRPIVVLHVDDHEDLQAPRLRLPAAGDHVRHPTDLFTGLAVDSSDPPQVAAAIRSGAIGMGSFLPPLLHARSVQLRHLKPGPFRGRVPGRYAVALTEQDDPIAGPGVRRPACSIGAPDSEGAYVLAEEPEAWLAGLPTSATVLLHVDADAFNDRYDGDSDWQEHERRHDPDGDRVAASVRETLDALSDLLPDITSAHVAVSPGFFPAEHWQPTVDALLSGLAGHGKAIRPRRSGAVRRPLATPADVRLEEGSGSSGHGGGRTGKFWHVFIEDGRAGRAWINERRFPDGASYAALTIELNEAVRGRGIGRVTYALAAEASGHDVVWLHMRRSNVASRRAAEYAGFQVVDAPTDPQLVMRWNRPDRR